MIRIIAIKITDRIKEVGLTQEVLSKYSPIITTRLGFHELTTEVCSREAYIIIHLSGTGAETELMIKDLKEIRGIELREMNFREKFSEKPDIADGKTRIFGLLVEQDHDLIVAIQKLLTSYGCVIRTRLGINEKFFGKQAGLILLELSGDIVQINQLEKDIIALKKVHFKKIVF